jgi:thioredoxin-related protein
MRTAFRTVVRWPVAGILLGAALLHAAAGAQTQPSADSLLSDAKNQAASGQRAIFAIFHASWCGWCREFDKFLDSPGVKPIIDKYFVRVYFTVQEPVGSKDLNTPGGDELLAALGGARQGMPFFAFLGGQAAPFFASMDGPGAMIVNSIDPGGDGKKGGNIGHPAEPHEVDWFLVMLGKAAPGMTAGERGVIEKYLRTQKN